MKKIFNRVSRFSMTVFEFVKTPTGIILIGTLWMLGIVFAIIEKS